MFEWVVLKYREACTFKYLNSYSVIHQIPKSVYYNYLEAYDDHSITILKNIFPCIWHVIIVL